MPEKPLLSIIDRDEAVKQITNALSPQLEMLRDLVNYGSNLIIRSFNSSDRQLGAIVVCGVLLKQVVAMVDTVEILVRNGQIHGAFLPARAAFEATMYLQWILVSDTDRKATCYMVSNYRKARLWASRSIKGTHEAAAFNEITSALGIDLHKNNPELNKLAEEQLAEVNRILAQSHFKGVDAEFDEIKRKDRGREPTWHKPVGAKSMRQIAKELGRLPDYEVFYSKGSQVTHSASYKDHLRFSDGTVHFIPVRSAEGLRELLISIMGSAISTYRAVLGYYRPAELSAFGRKYLEDWQSSVLAVSETATN
jgi:hypothetical protein